MDVLASVEPQLAIPVVGVVLCALLVYIFGFQKTQEPTFQHLAALTTKSKAPSARQRSTTPQVKSTLKAKEKSSSASTANGHAVQEKSSPKVNGTLKSAKSQRDGSNKENLRPQKLVAKEKKELAEDLESGDWIQAVSRKDKKNKLEKTKQESSQAAKPSLPIISSMPIAEAIQVLQDVTSKVATPTIQTEQVKVEAAKQQDAPTTPKPAKEPKKKAAKAPAPAPPTESSPKKEKPAAAQEPKVTPAATEVKAAVEEPVVKSAPVSPVKEVSKAEEPQQASAEPRNNIAFDEMGDAWEEAKSRGAKKRRARKD